MDSWIQRGCALEQDGHRFPIPVPDVDERFRSVSEDDPFEMDGLESAKQV